jgi:hypothetical protein
VSTPEVPDSISAESLNSFLRNCNPLPVSAFIPEINLGGPEGAPCDLQFCITQLIHKSTDGTNLIQLLTAAMYLLCEAEFQFEDQLQRLAIEEPPYDELDAGEQQIMDRLLRRHLLTARSSMNHLEGLIGELTTLFYRGRAQYLLNEVFTAEPSLADFRSHMLISDGALLSLGLERDAVTAYINGSARP